MGPFGDTSLALLSPGGVGCWTDIPITLTAWQLERAQSWEFPSSSSQEKKHKTKPTKQQGEMAYYHSKHQGLGAEALGVYFLLSPTYCTEQESVKLQFLNSHA